MTKRAGSNITYASYNLPTVINAGSNSSTLSYGAFRNRYKQVAVSSGATETTLYVAGLFEKVTLPSGVIEYRHYIPGGNGTAAIHTRRSTSINSTFYWHADHLGSPELFTDTGGTALVRPSFGAFGERRDGTDWLGPPSAADLTTLAGITRRGFTGHEHLDSVGLIHMSGRVYDPVAGRFLSSDPVRVVGLSQDANPYAYAWNNPLSVLDRNGFCEDPTTGEQIPCPLDPVDVYGDPWDECDWGGPWMAGWSQSCNDDLFLDPDEYVFEDEGGGGGGGSGDGNSETTAEESDTPPPCEEGPSNASGAVTGGVVTPAGGLLATTGLHDGHGFGTARVAWGWGAAASYNPKGGLPVTPRNPYGSGQMLTVSAQLGIALGIPWTPLAISFTYEGGYNISTEDGGAVINDPDFEIGWQAKKAVELHANIGASLTAYGPAHTTITSTETCRAN